MTPIFQTLSFCCLGSASSHSFIWSDSCICLVGTFSCKPSEMSRIGKQLLTVNRFPFHLVLMAIQTYFWQPFLVPFLLCTVSSGTTGWHGERHRQKENEKIKSKINESTVGKAKVESEGTEPMSTSCGYLATIFESYCRITRSFQR